MTFACRAGRPRNSVFFDGAASKIHHTGFDVPFVAAMLFVCISQERAPIATDDLTVYYFLAKRGRLMVVVRLFAIETDRGMRERERERLLEHNNDRRLCRRRHRC